jgi:kinesin family protein 18/19
MQKPKLETQTLIPFTIYFLFFQVLPKKINRDEEREILSLLCRVHELEIENTEMESLVFLKDHELRKKDLQITRYQQRRNLCDEIIHQQRVLITGETKLHLIRLSLYCTPA